MEEVFLESRWLGPLLWAALYISDNLFTIACARMYAAQKTVAFEGSYEITPSWQADVNALRRLSPRFLTALVLTTAYLAGIRWMVESSADLMPLYAGVSGAMLLVQATVHLRHFRNWHIFRSGSLSQIDGHIYYPRQVTLRMSAFELLGFSGLYLVLSLLTGSVFILGGALSCGALSVNHRLLARRHSSSASMTAAVARQS